MYPKSQFADSAKYQKYQIEMFESYAHAVNGNTLELYTNFVLKYYSGELVREAVLSIEKINFSRAKRMNTFNAYRNYKTECRNSVYSDSANIMIDSLRSLRHPVLRNLNKALVEINYSVYGGNESGFKKSLIFSFVLFLWRWDEYPQHKPYLRNQLIQQLE